MHRKGNAFDRGTARHQQSTSLKPNSSTSSVRRRRHCNCLYEYIDSMPLWQHRVYETPETNFGRITHAGYSIAKS